MASSGTIAASECPHADGIREGRSDPQASLVWLNALPEDLKAQFVAEAAVKGEAQTLADAVRCLLDQRTRRLPIDSIAPPNSKEAELIKTLDDNNDGFLSYEEIMHGVETIQRHKSRARGLTWMLVVVAVFSFIMLGGVYGLVYVVVDMHKDTRAMRGMLVNRADGTPIQVSR